MSERLSDVSERVSKPSETARERAFLARLWAYRDRLHTLVLWVILAVALFLRTYNVDWADGQLPHPDERSTIAFYAPTIHLPRSLEEALDPHRSPLNPLWDVNAQRRRSYTYGHFPLYLLVLTANVVAKTAPLFEALGASPETVAYIARLNQVPGFAVVGRILMALSDTLTVFLVYLIARRLYGRGWGLLAAAFTTFTVTHIQLAHYFAVDPMSTTFTMLAIYGAMRMAEEGRPRDAVLTGVGIALAVGSKFSALPIVTAPLIAVAVRSRWGRRLFNLQLSNLPSPTSHLQLLLLSFLTAALVFALTSPYVILDWPNFKQAVIVEQGAMVRGDADFPFTRQYRGTVPYLYHIEQSVKWGMGWGLGLLGWLGLAWAVVRAVRRRLQPGEWMLLAWIVFYFGPTGLFLAKFMRYTLPIVPALIILGTGLLHAISNLQSPISDHRGLEIRDGRFWRLGIGKWLAWGIGALVLGHAIFWSLAFVYGVYGHPHTWIVASRWIYQNVPDGAVLATEHWDDRLPLALPEPNANPARYRYVTMPMYDEDTPEKFEIIKNNLRQADYYVFASARLYRTIPRLPERYPMTTRFYDLFFAEKLGFVRVLDVTSYPRLGPFVFPDDEADESFWVYDHPRVLIYKKVRDLSDEEWNALLGGTWEGAKHWYVPKTFLQRLFEKRPFGKETPPAPEAEAGRKGPSLLLDMSFDEMPVVRFWRWNRWASEHTVPAVVIWWLVLMIIGAIAWPLTFVAFAWLHDRGYAFSKGVGLLLVAYLAWIVPSLRWWINDLPLVLAVVAVVLLLNAWIAHRFEPRLRAFLRGHWRLLLAYEGLFTAAYLFFVFIRLLNPDLWQPWNGGEKFMEIAYLNATVRSPYFPPYDPYFAGGTINYYYWGYQIVNVLIKLTGITPTVAFNLAVPTLFALTVVAACGVGYNAVRTLGLSRGQALRWGGVAAAFVALFGNPDGTVEILRNLALVSGSDFRSPTFPWLETLVQAWQGLVRVWNGEVDLPKYNYWNPSRVIPYTINEFPYWSFLFADLHPHMMGIPFTVLFLGLALNVVVAAGRSWFEGRDDSPYPVEIARPWVYALAQFGLLPLALGALAVINTWDLPTYLGIIALALFLRQWRARGRVNLLLWWGQVGAILAAAYLLYRPFFTHYAPIAASGVGWAPQKTSLGLWLNMWALWFFLMVSFMAAEVTRRDPFFPARWLRAFVVHYDRWPRFLRLASRRTTPANPHSPISNLQSPISGLEIRDWRLEIGDWNKGTGYSIRWWVGVTFAVPALAVGLWALGYRVPAVLVVPIVVYAVLTLRRRVPAGVTFATLLAFVGLSVLFGVEFLYLKDHLQGGDFKRMNTLFKFYIQAWVLLGLASAVGLVRVWERLPRWRPWVRAVWQVTFAVLVAASLTFLIVGTAARVDDRFPEGLSQRPPFGTLDGMAYMKYGVYTWPTPQHRIELKWDYEAIRWLLDNEPRVVPVAEARLDYYREGGTRVASFTGLPTFMGLHQMGEQRYGWQTGPRQQIAIEFWTTPDINRTLEIIRDIGIRYIYVGQLERQQYPPEAIAKFDRMVAQGWLEVVYKNPGVTIYRVRTVEG